MSGEARDATGKWTHGEHVDLGDQPHYRATNAPGQPLQDARPGHNAITDGVYFAEHPEAVKGYGSHVEAYTLPHGKYLVVNGDKHLDKINATAKADAESKLAEHLKAVQSGTENIDAKKIASLSSRPNYLRDHLEKQGYAGLKYVRTDPVNDHHDQVVLFRPETAKPAANRTTFSAAPAKPTRSLPMVQSKADPGLILPGPGGVARAEFLTPSMRYGQAVFERIAQDAISRLVTSKRRTTHSGHLFTNDERTAFVQAIGAPVVLADLVGRAMTARKAGVPLPAFGANVNRTVFGWLDPIAKNILEAIQFFSGLFPAIGIRPERYGAHMERDAFTMCVATEQTLLQRVQAIITRYLGNDWSKGYDERGPRSDGTVIRKTLIDAGVAPLHKQYSEMVFRTNVLDALNTGQTKQAAAFPDRLPVWRYNAIDDSRLGDDHRPMMGLYYPASVTFAEVRGDRVYNCRCGQRWITAIEWQMLQAKGAVLQTTWGEKVRAEGVAKGKAKRAAQSAAKKARSKPGGR